MGVFQAAAQAILRHEEESRRLPSESKQRDFGTRHRTITTLSKQEWVMAIIKGANDQSPRWRHLVVLVGILVGFEGNGRGGMDRSLRSTVASGIVTAVNLTLDDVRDGEDLGSQCLALTLNWAFELLPEQQRSKLDHLVCLCWLMAMVEAELFGSDCSPFSSGPPSCPPRDFEPVISWRTSIVTSSTLPTTSFSGRYSFRFHA